MEIKIKRCCLFRFNVAFNIICHITTVSGCDRELNAHFYCAASLWYQIPDTFTPVTFTGATSPSPTPKIRVPSGEQLVPLLTTLVCRGPGSNPVSPDLGADTLPTELPRPVEKIKRYRGIQGYQPSSLTLPKLAKIAVS